MHRFVYGLYHSLAQEQETAHRNASVRYNVRILLQWKALSQQTNKNQTKNDGHAHGAQGNLRGTSPNHSHGAQAQLIVKFPSQSVQYLPEWRTSIVALSSHGSSHATKGWTVHHK